MTAPEPKIDALLAELDECAAEMDRSASVVKSSKLMAAGYVGIAIIDGNRRMAKAHRDAAAALRSLRAEHEALRADFEKYADHDANCPEGPYSESPRKSRKCDCGLDAARARWTARRAAEKEAGHDS
jgi:hypothetical protein